jgi:hypothetical protein
MDNSINALEKTAFPISPNPNFTTIKETVVLPISTAEEDKMAVSITNIE